MVSIKSGLPKRLQSVPACLLQLVKPSYRRPIPLPPTAVSDYLSLVRVVTTALVILLIAGLPPPPLHIVVLLIGGLSPPPLQLVLLFAGVCSPPLRLLILRTSFPSP